MTIVSHSHKVVAGNRRYLQIVGSDLSALPDEFGTDFSEMPSRFVRERQIGLLLSD
ncbi:MAG: hypothetical protein ACRERU_13465 [Methylococcales bacterium]